MTNKHNKLTWRCGWEADSVSVLGRSIWRPCQPPCSDCSLDRKRPCTYEGRGGTVYIWRKGRDRATRITSTARIGPHNAECNPSWPIGKRLAPGRACSPDDEPDSLFSSIVYPPSCATMGASQVLFVDVSLLLSQSSYVYSEEPGLRARRISEELMSEDTREQPLHNASVGGTKTQGKDAGEGNVDAIEETWDAPRVRASRTDSLLVERGPGAMMSSTCVFVCLRESGGWEWAGRLVYFRSTCVGVRILLHVLVYFCLDVRSVVYLFEPCKYPQMLGLWGKVEGQT